jgi:hypothetical protein
LRKPCALARISEVKVTTSLLVAADLDRGRYGDFQTITARFSSYTML